MEHRDHTDLRRPRRIGGRRAAVATAILAAGAVLAGCGGGGSTSSSTSSTPAATPVALGSTQGEATGRTVDGIKCERQEQVLFHIHAHLAVFANGRPAIIPLGIGIAPPRTVDQSSGAPFVLGGSCFYWLHSHTADGIIHIESPMTRTFTLGNYFDLWNQPLSATQVSSATGPVTAYVNGKAVNGDPRAIPLAAHAVIQLDVGTKVAPAPYAFPDGL
ncbi:MAG: hypothetical protein QOF77_1182 [Solirubrobacteraceae bacterium]|jgi:hypothetical protein|nr:hypothetical protein [Solirubrobacteraceae bacterium]